MKWGKVPGVHTANLLADQDGTTVHVQDLAG
jgi:hypothetical protein